LQEFAELKRLNGDALPPTDDDDDDLQLDSDEEEEVFYQRQYKYLQVSAVASPFSASTSVL